jgi:hypothetical protein
MQLTLEIYCCAAFLSASCKFGPVCMVQGVAGLTAQLPAWSQRHAPIRARASADGRGGRRALTRRRGRRRPAGARCSRARARASRACRPPTSARSASCARCSAMRTGASGSSGAPTARRARPPRTPCSSAVPGRAAAGSAAVRESFDVLHWSPVPRRRRRSCSGDDGALCP